MARGPENRTFAREVTGTVVQLSGVIGGLVGLLRFDPVLAIVGGAVWLGGAWIRNTGKKEQYA